MTYDWLNRDAQTTPTVLVTVAIAEGSCPRETGAKMLVTIDAQYDTIGGGHLEMRACEIARIMLTNAEAPRRRLERFALGPSLGQCCGGVVHLAFERIDDELQADIDCLHQRSRQRQESWRLVPVDDAGSAVLLDRDGNCLGRATLGALSAVDFDAPCHVIRDQAGGRWLVDPCLPFRQHLVLFGAGHVGTAIVRALAELPCSITWVDEREEMFPQVLPANVLVEATDMPEFFADNAPAGSSFLVLTHSHALDQRLSEHILRRSSGDWFGLIGSKTKLKQFERRLAERGIPEQRLRDMVCPNG